MYFCTQNFALREISGRLFRTQYSLERLLQIVSLYMFLFTITNEANYAEDKHC